MPFNLKFLGTQQYQTPNKKLYVSVHLVIVTLLYRHCPFHLHSCLTLDFLHPFQKLRQCLYIGRLVSLQVALQEVPGDIRTSRENGLYPILLLGSEFTDHLHGWQKFSSTCSRFGTSLIKATKRL